jgi:GTP-binding protein EngB required for normal cell division
MNPIDSLAGVAAGPRVDSLAPALAPGVTLPTPPADERMAKHRPPPGRETLQALAQCLEELASLGIESAETVRELRERATAGRFDVVFAGQFKRGKTSLVNALIGLELLPVAVFPLTSVVTILSYGADVAATVVHESGEQRPIPITELASYVTERGNPNNAKHIREVQVTCPSPWLEDGIRLVDTPGVGSVYQHNTEAALRYLPQSDAVVFVLSVDQPLSEAECKFLSDVRQYADRIFFVLNKSDLVREKELDEALAFTHSALTAVLGSEPTLFPVSARLAGPGERDRAARDPSGMAAFARALDDFLASDKTRVLALSLARKLRRSLAQGTFALELELRTLSAPMADLERKASRFRDKRREIAATRSELGILLGNETTRALLRPLEERLDRCKRELKRDVAATLEQRFHAEHAVSLRELYARLEAEAIAAIRDGYDRWHAAEAEAMDRTFEDFCLRYAGRIETVVDDLYRFASELFSVPYQAEPAPGFHQARSHFYYKFWSEPTALHSLGSALLFSMPCAVGAPKVLARAQRYALDLTEMQAGRLRYDFSQRLERAVATFRRALEDRIDRALGAIDRAVDQALVLRERGERDSEARRTAARSTVDALGLLARRVDALVPRPAEQEAPQAQHLHVASAPFAGGPRR